MAAKAAEAAKAAKAAKAALAAACSIARFEYTAANRAIAVARNTGSMTVAAFSPNFPLGKS
ncbi:MAG: hypothetical protein ACXWU0_10275, partial [Rhodoplanes sp.]